VSWVLALLSFLIFSATVSSQAGVTLQQILTNGPTDKRINIVFLSEGYASSQLSGFPTDALEVLNALLKMSPYHEYRSYFNAFTIAVASSESGSDHPRRGVFRDTYFNSSFDSYGLQRLVTIPPNDRNAAYAEGQGKVDALLESQMPEYDIVILLVNDEEYGGSGGTTPIASRHAESSDIIIHELGHSFAGLGDEYSLPFPMYPDVEEPNTTTETNRSKIKWNAWIGPETPIPTPDSNLLDVGLFEGAHYHPKGWYRPKFVCKMRDLRFVFCEVCVETLIKAAYGLVRPIESFAPTLTNVSVQRSQSLPFQVQTLAPATHSLFVQWFTNGVPVEGAVSHSFLLSASDFNIGVHELKVEVSDLTSLVRTEPRDLLADSVTWTVVVDPEPLVLSVAASWQPLTFHFRVTGPPNEPFVIQSSSNLRDWINISSNRLDEQPFEFSEPSTSYEKARYFRAVLGPSGL